MKNWPLFFILALLLSLFLLRLVGNYMNCLIKHRDDFQLLTPREEIHAVCWANLNPFIL